MNLACHDTKLFSEKKFNCNKEAYLELKPFGQAYVSKADRIKGNTSEWIFFKIITKITSWLILCYLYLIFIFFFISFLRLRPCFLVSYDARNITQVVHNLNITRGKMIFLNMGIMIWLLWWGNCNHIALFVKHTIIQTQ